MEISEKTLQRILSCLSGYLLVLKWYYRFKFNNYPLNKVHSFERTSVIFTKSPFTSPTDAEYSNNIKNLGWFKYTLNGCIFKPSQTYIIAFAQYIIIYNLWYEINSSCVLKNHIINHRIRKLREINSKTSNIVLLDNSRTFVTKGSILELY